MIHLISPLDHGHTPEVGESRLLSWHYVSIQNPPHADSK